MRSLLLGFLLSSLLAAAPAAGQPSDVQRAFEAGNRSYAEGDYEAALRQYESVLQRGWRSGALYYNAAGAHYRMGRLGEAVRHYEKARPLLPGSERLQHNLAVVRGQLGAPPPAPRSFLSTVRTRLTGWLPPLGYLGVGGLLYLLALAWWVYTSTDAARPFRPRPGPAALLVAGLLVAALGLALSAHGAAERAVAVRGALVLRAGPAASADSTAGVPEGTVLRLTNRQHGWRQVRSAEGASGWAPADALGEI